MCSTFEIHGAGAVDKETGSSAAVSKHLRAGHRIWSKKRSSRELLQLKGLRARSLQDLPVANHASYRSTLCGHARHRSGKEETDGRSTGEDGNRVVGMVPAPLNVLSQEGRAASTIRPSCHQVDLKCQDN